MAISLTSVLVHAAAAPVLEAVTHPLRSFIAAEYAPQDVQNRYNSWQDRPLMLPEAGALLDAFNRYYIEDTQGWFSWALRAHGVNLGSKRGARFDDRRAWLWNAVVEAQKTVPGAEVWAHMGYRGILTPAEAVQRIRWAGGNAERWQEGIRLGLQRPSAERVNDAALRGLLDDLDWREEVKKAGGDVDDFSRQWVLYSDYPGILESISLANRLGWGEEQFRHALRRNRVITEEAVPLYAELRKGLPGVADLNMFGIRHSWQPELVERYGYYLEFPERLRPWYSKLGLNYGVGFEARTDTGLREVTLADAYWASHWHVLPLNAAFQAYQRFQPDLVRRFQVDNPNLQPFLRDDLNVHMRQADFPPGVRDWLTALAHPVLGKRDINWGAQFLGWDRGEIQARYRLLGFTTDDAAAQAAIAENREAYRQAAWSRSLADSTRKRTIKMIEGLYEDGTINRDFALRQLSDAGLATPLSTQILDIVDFGVERTLVRQAIRATGRDFLSGVLSRGDAEIQLGRIGVTGSRIQNYVFAWGIQRDARRKRLETGKIQAMVAEGLLSSGEARARLVNLQWSDPDATLLLAEAAGKLAKREAQEAKSRDADIRARARELDRLAKEADAQSRKLRSEANRVAPRSVLLKWMTDGEISEDSFRSMMRERGYSDPIIDKYIEDSKNEKPPKPRPAPTAPPWPKPRGSAHPMQPRLALWLADGIITSDQYAQGLRDLGYSDDDTAKYVRDAQPETANGAPGPSAGS